MSVLIKDMAMPKDCVSCPLTTDYGTCGYYSLFVEAGHEVPFAGRLEECPLIEIPKHGRLIDADEASERVWKLLRFPSNLANGQWFVNVLREMPTVIPEDSADNDVNSEEVLR